MHSRIYALLSSILWSHPCQQLYADEPSPEPTIKIETPCRQLSQLAWLLGEWHSASDGKVQEHWQKLDKDTYSGFGLSIDPNGQKKQTESLRLVAMQSEVFYLAKVSHNGYPIPFKGIQCTDKSVIFQNPEHDFPNQIAYFRFDDRLQVRVSGKAQKGFSLNFVLANTTQ